MHERSILCQEFNTKSFSSVSRPSRDEHEKTPGRPREESGRLREENVQSLRRAALPRSPVVGAP